MSEDEAMSADTQHDHIVILYLYQKDDGVHGYPYKHEGPWAHKYGTYLGTRTLEMPAVVGKDTFATSKAKHVAPAWLRDIGVAVIAAIVACVAVGVPATLRNQALSEQCASIEAQPVRHGLFVRFCEMPDGTIVGIPEKTP